MNQGAHKDAPPGRCRTRFLRSKVRVDFLFLALLPLIVIVNYPYLHDAFVPMHDTFARFQIFHSFYSEFLYKHQLAEWIPYGAFGLPAQHLQLASLTPISYLFGVIGAFERTGNLLLLFKLSIIGEQFVFLAGMYLLGRQIFSRNSTACLVSVAAACGTIWYSQLDFDFRIYYLLPLVLYLLVAFFRRRRPEFLWLAGTTGVAWAIGCPRYFVPLWFFVLAVFSLVLLLYDRSVIRRLVAPSWTNLVTFAVFVIVATVYIYCASAATENVVVSAPGRDTATGMVTLDTFLKYGGRVDPLSVLQALILGWPIHLPWASKTDNSVYLGLLPLVFFVWAALKERSPVFIALLIAFMVLVFLSFGSLFATAVYFFPAMCYYRHVGLVYGLVKIFMLLCAGFGLENYWSSDRKIRPLIVIMIALALLVDPLLGHGEGHPGDPWFLLFLGRMVAYSVLLGLAMGIIRVVRSVRSAGLSRAARVNIITASLILGLVLDMLSFQYMAYVHRPVLPPSHEGLAGATYASRLEFQAQRRQAPIMPRAAQAIELSTNPLNRSVYWFTYSFAQFDPSQPEFRTALLSSGLHRLLQTRKAGDPELMDVLGASTPKLRLVSEAIIAEDDMEAERLVRTISDLDKRVVLTRLAGANMPSGKKDVQGPLGKLDVTEFSTNHLALEANVTAKDGAWLVYADCNHPGWHATVNGEEVPIATAYLAFKAVWLNAGRNVVRFEFRNGLASVAIRFIALFGFGAGLCFCGLIVGVAFTCRARSQASPAAME